MNNKNILISIIIPCYNSSNTIRKCIDSIINQSYKNLEIIIIDDGSKDNTFDICKEIQKKDNRIKLFKKNNSGVSATRNFGVSHANGDYVTFVDSDDYLEFDCYERITKSINICNYDFIRYNFKYDFEKTNNNLHLLINGDISSIDEKLLVKTVICSSSIYPTYSPLLIIKKNIAKNIVFDEKLSYLEDKDYYLSLIEKTKKGYFLDEKKYIVTINNESASRNIKNSKNNIRSILALMDKIKNYYLYEQYSDIINASLVSNICYMLPNTMIDSFSECKRITNEIINNKNINNVYRDLAKNELSFKDKVIIFTLKNKFKILLYILLIIIIIIKRIKKGD
ncbi:MAG: glycosyltransferase family 2 protein [Bacilli bacterium]|nr:glycosyltransferase family 2 protein [Bacilli bacterium]